MPDRNKRTSEELAAKLMHWLHIDRSSRNAYAWGMDVIPIRPERKAQLEDYAQRHGQDAAAALDAVLAEFLEGERQDYEASVAAIRGGYDDMKAGRTRPAADVLEEIREKHGFSR
jgi:predicted transcriptional regulator